MVLQSRGLCSAKRPPRQHSSEGHRQSWGAAGNTNSTARAGWGRTQGLAASLQVDLRRGTKQGRGSSTQIPPGPWAHCFRSPARPASGKDWARVGWGAKFVLVACQKPPGRREMGGALCP